MLVSCLELQRGLQDDATVFKKPLSTAIGFAIWSTVYKQWIVHWTEQDIHSLNLHDCRLNLIKAMFDRLYMSFLGIDLQYKHSFQDKQYI